MQLALQPSSLQLPTHDTLVSSQVLVQVVMVELELEELELELELELLLPALPPLLPAAALVLLHFVEH
jgi:hypothetical protein